MAYMPMDAMVLLALTDDLIISHSLAMYSFRTASLTSLSKSNIPAKSSGPGKVQGISN